MTASAGAAGLTPRQRDIVGAARIVLAEQGPDALTVRAIAATCHAAPSGLLHHFSSVDEILEAMYLDIVLELSAVLDPRKGPRDIEGAWFANQFRTWCLDHPHEMGYIADHPPKRFALHLIGRSTGALQRSLSLITPQFQDNRKFEIGFPSLVRIVASWADLVRRGTSGATLTDYVRDSALALGALLEREAAQSEPTPR